MDGFRSVGAFEPNMDGYFGWVAQNGFPLPEKREDIWLPEGEDAVPGATERPARIPKELSDSSFFTERALTYLKGRAGRPFFLHLGYYRPHPPFVAPAPYHEMYRAEDMPAPVRAASPEAEGAQHPLIKYYVDAIKRGSFFHGAEGSGATLDEAEIRQMRATYCGLISEIDDCLGKVFAFLDETGQWDDTLVVFTSRPWRAARRPSSARQDRLPRRELPHPAGGEGSARRGRTRAARSRRPSPKAST